jgi:7,8-dihydropterin-6-yl-methyl-4-(beta-D-ribofuranosyl)aminobenzene 5'-phosphate synthase
MRHAPCLLHPDTRNLTPETYFKLSTNNEARTPVNFTVTTLVENSVAQGGKSLLAEHGLSFYLEAGEHRILFDTGQNLAIANNARVLGIDLSQIEAVVLSHGHYDHTGGLQSLLQSNKTFSLYGHPDVFGPKVRESNGKYHYIGIPIQQNEFVENGISLKLDKKAVEIVPGVMTSGEIPLKNDFEDVESGFLLKNENDVVRDTLTDDHCLILETAKGLVVLLGCSHRGLINTLNHVTHLKSTAKIHAVLGGLHLGKASDGKLATIIDHLRGFDPEMIGVGHCTGPRAFLALSNEFKNRVFFNTVGKKVVF